MPSEYQIIRLLGNILETERKELLEEINAVKRMYFGEERYYSASELIDRICTLDCAKGFKYFQNCDSSKEDSSRYKLRNAKYEDVSKICCEAMQYKETKESFEILFGNTKESVLLKSENTISNPEDIKAIKKAMMFVLSYNDYKSKIKRLRTKNQKNIDGNLLEFMFNNYKFQVENIMAFFAGINSKSKILRNKIEIKELLLNQIKTTNEDFVWYPLCGDYLSTTMLYMVIVPCILMTEHSRELKCVKNRNSTEFKTSHKYNAKREFSTLYIVVSESFRRNCTPSIDMVCDRIVKIWKADKKCAMVDDEYGYSLFFEGIYSKGRYELKYEKAYMEAIREYEDHCANARDILLESMEILEDTETNMNVAVYNRDEK